jgi:hypothetical protein
VPGPRRARLEQLAATAELRRASHDQARALLDIAANIAALARTQRELAAAAAGPVRASAERFAELDDRHGTFLRLRDLAIGEAFSDHHGPLEDIALAVPDLTRDELVAIVVDDAAHMRQRGEERNG